MRMRVLRWLVPSALTLLSLAFALTPAGTIIRNQAIARVGDEVYYSNVVETLVQPVCRPDLRPDGEVGNPGQEASVTQGGRAYLLYTLTNAGNDTYSFTLGTLVSGASDWTPVATAFYLDENQNAQRDPGEPAVTWIRLDPDESADLLLEVVAPTGQVGDLWITPTAKCPSGEADEDNFALVRLVSGPSLAVSKSFFPTEVRPGDETEVEIWVRNVGDAPAEGVYLTDDLAPLSDAFAYVPGSATAPKGEVEYRAAGGADWLQEEPEEVGAIRLFLPRLLVGEEAYLRFALAAKPGAPPGSWENVALAEGPGGPVNAVSRVEVLPVYEHHLGPKGNPRALPGGEGSPDDWQRAELYEDQTYCFGHTLENAGNAADSYVLEPIGVPEGVDLTLVRSGVPLELPLPLAGGEQLDFELCLVVPEPRDEPFVVELVARSVATGAENRTYDEVTKVWPLATVALEKSVEPEGTVPVNTELVYTLRAVNKSPFALTDVVVVDELDPHLVYLESTPPATYDEGRHRLIWRLERLDPGATFEAKVKVRVAKDTPDDTRIHNRFTLRSAQLPNPLVSNEVPTPVWSSGLLITKEVNPKLARYGDRLTYTLRVHNPSTATMVTDITDTPDPYLEYIPGTAKPWEPEVKDGKLIWRQVRLAPGETITITYEMRVLPGAPEKLHNVVYAVGKGASGAEAEAEARARTQTVERVFQRRTATLIGRVYFDFDEDGVFDEGQDRPLPGARIILSDGRQVVTDYEGRYAFRDIPAGPWLVTLDRASAPFEPLPHPEADEEGYAHRVRAEGLTISDFPLRGPEGLIAAWRKTRLEMGPFRVDKELIPLPDGRVRVVLHLVSEKPLPDFTLRDPLPTGGEKVFHFPVFEGEKTITYEFQGPPIMTDPEVRWRYP